VLGVKGQSRTVTGENVAILRLRLAPQGSGFKVAAAQVR
jgi:hypothetical protein